MNLLGFQAGSRSRIYPQKQLNRIKYLAILQHLKSAVATIMAADIKLKPRRQFIKILAAGKLWFQV